MQLIVANDQAAPCSCSVGLLMTLPPSNLYTCNGVIVTNLHNIISNKGSHDCVWLTLLVLHPV